MKEKNEFENVLWEMFRATGDINYYEFYNRLKNGEKDGRDSNKERRL